MNEARYCVGRQVLSFVLVFLGVFSVSVMAAGTNDVPHLDSFESYDAGHSILNENGWSKAAEFSAGARTTTDASFLNLLTDYINGGGGLPLAETHNQLLEVRGDVQNDLGGPVDSIVLTDVLILPEFRLEPPPEADPNLQCGVYVNSNGLLYVFHANQTIGSNQWDALTAGPVVPTNQWIRMRVLKDYANHSFQVRVDEGAPVSDADGWDAPSGGSQPGSWFRMVQTNNALSRLIIRSSGDTVIDDLVVASAESVIDTLSPENVASGQADLRGFLSHTGLSSTAVEVYYGTSNGGPDPAAWEATNVWVAPRPQGLHVFNATGLTFAKHFYRFAAVNDFGRIWADDTEMFLAYDVTITAPDSEAKEEGPETGTIRVSRPGSATGGDVTVNLNIDGTAGNGVDYASVANTIVISNGQTDVDITITPIPDLPEGDETVVISIAPDGYGIGTPATAVVNIVDGPINELIWWNRAAPVPGAGNANWDHTSSNWFDASPLSFAEVFVDGDEVTFGGNLPERIYVGSADWNGVDGWSNAIPADVFPSRTEVSTATYQLEGGSVRFGSTYLVGSNGELIDRNIGNEFFGTGPVYLQGGKFHRQVTDNVTVGAGQSFSNDVIVEVTGSVLDGLRGNNNWLGDLELKATLMLNKVGGASLDHDNYFMGDLVINKDTNFTGVRGIFHDGQNGEIFIQGPIIDDTNVTHTGSYALHLGSKTAAQDIHIENANNTYTCGTVVVFQPAVSNQNFGVVVKAGSSMGGGDVVVQGSNGVAGARLTINASGGILGDLTVEPHARVIMNAIDDFSGKTMLMKPESLALLNTGSNIVDSATVVLEGNATLQVGGGIIETVSRMIVGGTELPSRIYDNSDLPNNIAGSGAVEVIGSQPTSLMMIIY